jgi:hypothetical protein
MLLHKFVSGTPPHERDSNTQLPGQYGNAHVLICIYKLICFKNLIRENLTQCEIDNKKTRIKNKD